MGYDNNINTQLAIIPLQEPILHANLNNIEYDEQADNERIRESRIINGNMYIGLPVLAGDTYVLENFITPNSYFNYNYATVYNYLTDWSTTQPCYATPQIMRLHINHIWIGTIYTESYDVVIKTFWIKIVQRRWKKVFRERMSKILTMRLMISLELLSYTQYVQGLEQLPTIRGMMA